MMEVQLQKAEPPSIVAKDDSTITFASEEGQEYILIPTVTLKRWEESQEKSAKDADELLESWQDSPVFEGLKPFTSYHAFTRRKAEDDEPAGEISEPVIVTTNHEKCEIKHCLIDGIYWYQCVRKNQTISFEVFGDGMENRNPIQGDTRLRPVLWCINGDKAYYGFRGYYFDCFSIRTRGESYLEIVFAKDTYEEEEWKEGEDYEYLRMPFTVV